LSARGKKRLLRLGLAFAALAAFAALSLTVLFPVTRCVVVGQTRYTALDFAAAMELGAKRVNLFRADGDALARAAMRRLPYARITKISRQLPNALRLTVEEYAPAFAQQAGERWWLIAENGRLLERVEAPPEGLLLLSGAPLAGPRAGRAARWDKAFTRPGDLRRLIDALRGSAIWPSVTGLRISSFPVPDVIYQGRIRIRFGGSSPEAAASPAESLKAKLELAESILAKLEEQNPNYRGELDLGTARGDFSPKWGDWAP